MRPTKICHRERARCLREGRTCALLTETVGFGLAGSTLGGLMYWACGAGHANGLRLHEVALLRLGLLLAG